MWDYDDKYPSPAGAYRFSGLSLNKLLYFARMLERLTVCSFEDQQKLYNTAFLAESRQP